MLDPQCESTSPKLNRNTFSWWPCWTEPCWFSVIAASAVQHTWLRPSPPASRPLHSADPGRPVEWAAQRLHWHCGPPWQRPPHRASRALRPTTQPLPGSPPFAREHLGRFSGPPERTEPCEAAHAHIPQHATPWCGQRILGWPCQTPAGLQPSCGNKNGSLTWGEEWDMREEENEGRVEGLNFNTWNSANTLSVCSAEFKRTHFLFSEQSSADSLYHLSWTILDKPTDKGAVSLWERLTTVRLNLIMEIVERYTESLPHRNVCSVNL